MRVLITNSARPFIGEAAHCIGLAEQLVARNHEVLLVVRRGFELEKRVAEKKLPHVSLAFHGDFRPLADWRDVRALRRLIRDWHPDVIHCHRGKDHWLAAMAVRSFSPRTPIVRTRHVVIPVLEHYFNHWLYEKATSQIIAVSQIAADSFGQMRPALESKLTVIYSAVDSVRFNPENRSQEWRAQHGVKPDDMLIGLIARMQRIKGQRIFMKAASELAASNPHVKFLMAGRGDPRRLDVYRKFGEKKGFGDRLIVLGWLENVHEAIASFDIGLVASLGSEGSSRITYEYMASGVPVVATTVGCIPEIVSDRQTGVLVPPGHTGKLREALESVLADEQLRKDMSSRALEKVRREHTFDLWIEAVMRVYQRAVDERASV